MSHAISCVCKHERGGGGIHAFARVRRVGRLGVGWMDEFKTPSKEEKRGKKTRNCQKKSGTFDIFGKEKDRKL